MAGGEFPDPAVPPPGHRYLLPAQLRWVHGFNATGDALYALDAAEPPDRPARWAALVDDPATPAWARETATGLLGIAALGTPLTALEDERLTRLFDQGVTHRTQLAQVALARAHLADAPALVRAWAERLRDP